MATVRPGKQAALVVVDAQQGVIGDAWEADRVIGNIALAVERARAAGVPVVWVQQEDDEYPRGSATWEIAAGLSPRSDEARIAKRHNSSFEDTPLEALLESERVSHLVVAGASTNWCIRATVYGALERGYDVTLLKDAHTTNPIDLGDGTSVDARGIVADLNLAATWLSYPGRQSGTARAAEVDFATPGGVR